MSLNINQIYNALAVNGQVNVDRRDHCTVDKTGGIKVALMIGGNERTVKLRDMTFVVSKSLESNDLGEVQKARRILDHINAIKASQHGILVRIHRIFDAIVVRLHLLADRITHRRHGHLPVPQIPDPVVIHPVHQPAPVAGRPDLKLIDTVVELHSKGSSEPFVMEMVNRGIGVNPTSTLSLILHRARPKDLAMETMKALAEVDSSGIIKVQIRQRGSRAFDAGGVSRQFFCDLFTDLVTTSPGKNYFDMSSGFAVPNFPKMPPDQEAIKFYQDLGKVLALCAKCKIQIGEIFGREIFNIVSKMSQNPLYMGESMTADPTQLTELDPSLAGPLHKYLANLEKFSDDELTAFCQQFPNMEPKGGVGLDRKGKMAAIAQVRWKDLQAIYGDDIDSGLSTEEFMKEAAKLLMSDHEQTIKPKVLAIFEVMKSMKKDLNAAALHDGKALGDKILGEPMDARVLVSRIRFNVHSEMPEEKQEWIRNAIRKLNQKQVEQFIYCTTGSKGLFPEAVISFYHVLGNDKIATCSRTVSFDSSRITTQEGMDQFILSLASESENRFNAV